MLLSETTKKMGQLLLKEQGEVTTYAVIESKDNKFHAYCIIPAFPKDNEIRNKIFEKVGQEFAKCEEAKKFSPYKITLVNEVWQCKRKNDGKIADIIPSEQEDKVEALMFFTYSIDSNTEICSIEFKKEKNQVIFGEEIMLSSDQDKGRLVINIDALRYFWRGFVNY